MTITRSSPGLTGTPVSTNGQGPAPGRNINIGRTALGVLLVVGLSAWFALAYAAAGDRKSVLAVARAVPAGQAITAEDLKEVMVSADPALQPVPATERASVVGRPVGVALVPGTLLSRAHLATDKLLPAGRDVVGLSLKPGQVPLGVAPGDPVIVVGTPTSASSSTDPDVAEIRVLATNAKVLAVEPPAASGDITVVSVIVDAGDAPAVAGAGASGQASVIVQGGR